MPNRLASESSPYLLQHKDNPVDWYPWGPEALDRAQAEDKPIFLSIGYSACHWCHVMEHESFESDQISQQLNKSFVCIKVDREERPDLDQIYMTAVQLMTGHGGWPMSVFLTPRMQPFFGGTYWPPTAQRGMPGFDQVITSVVDAWVNRRNKAIEQAEKLTEHLSLATRFEGTSGDPDPGLLQRAAANLEHVFDFTYGGFGREPKFPHAMDLQLLLRVDRRWPSDTLRKMVTLNLDKMAAGGIYDHLAGGFSRYSVDAQWLVPHFEKMLYDNALLAGAYLDAYLVTGRDDYTRVVRETLDYTLTYMTDEQGGFHSTEDADSEGEEGKFYVWTVDQVQEILGQELAERFCYVYDVTEEGNFEGKNILNQPKPLAQCAAIRGWEPVELEAQMHRARNKLLAVRDQRVRPAKDDKVLVSWNGLMIDTMARAAGILDEPKYLEAATRATQFILTQMTRDDGRLLHSWRHGQAKLDAYLDDYACLANALVSLYESGFDEQWIDQAMRLTQILLDHFYDKQDGGFFFTADDHEQLITRSKDMTDSSVPGGNAMAATTLLRLGKLCGRGDLVQIAANTLNSAGGLMKQSATAAGQMLIALDIYLGPVPEIVVLGEVHQHDTAALLSDLRRRYVPNRVLACRSAAKISGGSPSLDPIFAGKEAQDCLPTIFVCQDFTCDAPVSGSEAILQTWVRLASEN